MVTSDSRIEITVFMLFRFFNRAICVEKVKIVVLNIIICYLCLIKN